MIPELPTEESVKPVLAEMMAYYALSTNNMVVQKVAWMDAIPQDVLKQMDKVNAKFLLRQKDSSFLIGYKGADFSVGDHVYIPTHTCPYIPLQTTLKIALA